MLIYKNVYIYLIKRLTFFYTIRLRSNFSNVKCGQELENSWKTLPLQLVQVIVWVRIQSF